jgi:hypothetical protein
MRNRPAVLLASMSVAIFAIVNAAAATLGPAAARILLLAFAIAAVGVAVQTVALELAALKWALLFSMPPVISLITGDSPTWLIGPLGALLLIASELCALSWDIRGAELSTAIPWDRLRSIGVLGALGLVASLAVGGLASGPILGATLAVALGGVALGGVALAVFGQTG